jgi:hypothetical protein
LGETWLGGVKGDYLFSTGSAGKGQHVTLLFVSHVTVVDTPCGGLLLLGMA